MQGMLIYDTMSVSEESTSAGLKGMQALSGTGAFFLAGQIMVRLGFYIPAKRAMAKLEQFLH